MMGADLRRRTAAEGLGTTFLLMAVVGSGIMAERLAGGNTAIALLANAIATGGALVALILTFGPISGAHFNPVVTLAFAFEGELTIQEAASYIVAQIAGAIFGIWVAHLMFGLPILQLSAHPRGTIGECVGEFIATFGLLGLILSGSRHAPRAVPYGVAAYITAAYWFTASTSFANPAVTLARSLTNTFAGIEPGHVAPFIMAQLVGGTAAFAVFKYLLANGKPISAGAEAPTAWADSRSGGEVDTKLPS